MPYKDPDKRRESSRKNMKAWIKRNPEEHKRKAREQMRVWRSEHRDVLAERNEKRKKEFQLWWLEYKSKLSCGVCGENNPVCLDFHHINPTEKDSNISRITNGSWPCKKQILKELTKCIVLCANCHRKLHAEIGFTNKPVRKTVQKVIENKPIQLELINCGGQ